MGFPPPSGRLYSRLPPAADFIDAAVIPLAFAVHPPDYLQAALEYFHADPKEAALFLAVYKADYLAQQEGIQTRKREAPLYVFHATQTAPPMVQP